MQRMMNKIAAVFGLMMLLSACATSNKQMAASGGAPSITTDDLSRHLSFLASDELQGRDTGSEGLQRAAEYVANELRRLQLKPAGENGTYFQNYRLISRQLTDSTRITIADNDGQAVSFRFKDDFFPYLQSLQEGRETISGEVAFVGYGITAPEFQYDDFAGIDVKDKIVLALRHEPQTTDTSARFDGAKTTRYSYINVKARAAEAAGAKAIIIVNAPNDSGPAYGVEFKQVIDYLAQPLMQLADKQAEEQGQSIRVILADVKLADALLHGSGKSLSQLQTQIDGTITPNSFLFDRQTFSLTIDVKTKPVQASNILGLLEGSDSQLKHEAVVYSAHLDHVGLSASGEIFNGADDDASGSSAVLEIAEAYATSSRKPKRSMLFVWFTGEEKGLLGSEYYAENPVVALNNTVANLNMDMVGRVRQPGDSNPKNAGLAEEQTIYVVGGHQNPELKDINEASARAVGLFCDYRYGDPNHPKRVYYRSDHYNFARHGVPVLFFTTGEHEDYHQITDDIEKIDFRKLQRVAQMAFLTGWQVANQAKRVKPANVPASN